MADTTDVVTTPGSHTDPGVRRFPSLRTAPKPVRSLARYAALSNVPAATRLRSSIGRTEPSRKRFCPSAEYKNSSHSRAAAGCGADALIAWL